MDTDTQRLAVDRNVVASLLRAQREKNGTRQADVAEKLGHTQSFVSKYESGERRLDLAELRDVCCALGTTLSDFVALYEETLMREEKHESK